MYRPPNTDIKLFNDNLEAILDTIKKENKTCYIMGDFNINILNHDTNIPTSEFVDTMFSYGYLPLINRPTRVCSTTATLIDNIYTNAYDMELVKILIVSCTQIFQTITLYFILHPI